VTSGRQDEASLQGRFEVSGTAVWIGQAVHVTLQVEGDSPFASLDAGSARLDGIEVLPRPHARHPVAGGGEQRTGHELGWVLYPQIAGDLRIELPPVEYRRDGVITHLIHPPAIQLRVRPLPLFVPPTMPIGRMDLDVSLPDGRFLVKDELNFLELRITAEGPPGRNASVLLRQLRSEEAVTFYPPRDVTDERPGHRDERVYQIPFAPGTTGRISLPVLRLQYFDPSTGKIVTGQHALGSHVSLPRWSIHAAMALLLLGTGMVLRYLYRILTRKLQVFRSYRAAVRSLRRAETPGELKTALMHVAEAESWPGNITLASWRCRWLRRHPGMSRVADDILRLQALHYGRKVAAIEPIRAALIDICHQRMPLLKLSEYARRG
jgi:hypothetical protein